ncbi:MAG: lipopolysaccharide assembly protein LapA domain-containing protein [Patescibacteria group bacterium]
MISLIILIISGAGFAYFATQNTARISINLYHYTVDNIPVYVVVLAALLIGIVICWIISFFGFVSTTLKIFGKNSKIKEGTKEIENLKKRIHDLELENENLKGKTSS